MRARSASLPQLNDAAQNLSRAKTGRSLDRGLVLRHNQRGLRVEHPLGNLDLVAVGSHQAQQVVRAARVGDDCQFLAPKRVEGVLDHDRQTNGILIASL